MTDKYFGKISNQVKGFPPIGMRYFRNAYPASHMQPNATVAMIKNDKKKYRKGKAKKTKKSSRKSICPQDIFSGCYSGKSKNL
jgi:hypothetical protein